MSLMLSLLIDPARAALVSQTVCVNHVPNFDDIGVGEDLYTNNNAKDAIGIRVKLHRDSPTGPVVLDTHADDTGCFTQLLNDVYQFHARIISEYDVHGRTVEIREDDGTFHVITSTAFTPTNGTRTYNIDGSAFGTDWVSVAAAAVFTVYRRWSDFPAVTYEVWVAAYPPGGTGIAAGVDPSTGILYVDPTTNSVRRKYTIAHEVGHLLQFHANSLPNYPWIMDYGAADDSICTSYDTPGQPATHWTNSKEFQSAALMEGFANYVSDVAFNNTTGSLDCIHFPPGAIDWNNDNTVDSQAAYSCEGREGNEQAGIEYSFGVNPRDYLGQYCLTPSGGSTPDEDNRATELDWERFFWDADTDHSLTFGDLVTIWVGAGPHDWHADDNGQNPPVGGDFPSARMATSFSNFGAAAYNNIWVPEASSNGVDR